jgi:methionyl-tRNA synthetase
LGEAQKYIDMGLVDRAATRQLDWGVEVPVEGYEDKRIYVWIEAVLGYLSVGEEVAKSRGIDFDKFLSDDNANLKTYYVHGKDNIPFHTTIYPALLLSLKENYRLPDYIVSSAYVNLNNEKMSKSKGNIVYADALAQHFGTDTVRYYLLHEIPFNSDGTFTYDLFIDRINSDLANVLGNLVNRTIKNNNRAGKLTLIANAILFIVSPKIWVAGTSSKTAKTDLVIKIYIMLLTAARHNFDLALL